MCVCIQLFIRLSAFKCQCAFTSVLRKFIFFSQIYNFLRFCEVLYKSKANVKQIILNTGQDDVSKASSLATIESWLLYVAHTSF